MFKNEEIEQDLPPNDSLSSLLISLPLCVSDFVVVTKIYLFKKRIKAVSILKGLYLLILLSQQNTL